MGHCRKIVEDCGGYKFTLNELDYSRCLSTQFTVSDFGFRYNVVCFRQTSVMDT